MDINLRNQTGKIVLRQTGRTGPAGPPGLGVPAGGTTGQILAKESSTDNDTEWKTLTKTDVGLGNVDNTSDTNKPISTATQTALDTKANEDEVILIGGQSYPSRLEFGTTNEQGMNVLLNGNPFIRITPIGNMGINVGSDPEVPFLVGGGLFTEAGSVFAQMNPDSGTDLAIGTTTNHPVHLQTNSNTVLTLDTDKSVTSAGPINTNATGNDAVLPIGRAGAINTGISIQSSFDGGEDNGVGTDSTGRLNLYSYQRAQTGSFGETIRHFLMRADAKAMNAWYMPKAGYNPDETPDTSEGWSPVWWIGAHWEANDNLSIHGHGSIEVPDLTGAVQTRLEVPFIDQENPPAPGEPIGIAITNIRTNLADFSVRASSGVLRVGGQNQYNKDILFSLDSSRIAQYERWKLRANSTTETGSNVGTDFQINRYSDTGAFLASAFFIKRDNGRVGINNTTPGAQLHVSSTGGTILRLNSTDAASLVGMILMETANATRRSFQSQVLGDTIARFSLETSGLMEWGAGGGTARDTNLYRSAANVLKTDDKLDAATFAVAGVNGASGSFTTVDGKTVTVTSGLITAIV